MVPKVYLIKKCIIVGIKIIKESFFTSNVWYYTQEFFLNKTNRNISRHSVIYQQTINTHDLCYQCSKYGSEFLFYKLTIRSSRDEPHFMKKKKTLMSNPNEYIV